LTSEPQLILDYASPRKRGKVRLPARSVLEVTQDARDASVRIVETLSGREFAIIAIVFGVFVAAVAGFGAVRETLWVLHHRHYPIDFLPPMIMAVAALAELVLGVFVIRNTWRQTTLTADRERVTLTFTGPMQSPWRREWTCEEIGEVALISTQAETDAIRLAEIRLRPRGLLINLFTDHRESELADIADRLNRAIKGEGPPPVDAQPAKYVHVPDPQTLERLRGKRQELHDRLH
jgi:hypothetical protein